MASAKTIGELIRTAETNYKSGNVFISRHVKKSMRDDLDKIDAYINSKFTSGDKDSQGRDKPFFNICTAARNIWYRATDINRKDIKISAKKIKNLMLAFIATLHLQDYMERDYFGKFLNKWGLTLATYGSAVCKFVVKDAKLHAEVIPWNRLIVDPISFKGNPVIEILEFTESELRSREGYDQEIVGKLCDALTVRKTVAGENKDNRSDYIKLYEIHGELPLKYKTGREEDEYTFKQQMFVVTFVAGKEEGEFDDYILASGEEEKSPYMITHLIEEEGQTLSIGAVQNLFEAQWMMNHTVKQIKDQLDLASKLVFQTSDPNFLGKNALTNIENGDIMIHAINQPITNIANTSHDITALQNYQNSWKSLGMEINGISEAMMGINPPSRTPWRQTQTILQESYSLFELMKQNKKLDVEEMLRVHIIPFIKKYRLNDDREIVAELASHDITKIDSAYVKNIATNIVNQRVINAVLDGEDISEEDRVFMMQQTQAGIQEGMASLGNQRSFAPEEVNWKKEFENLEWDIRVDVEGENIDTQEALTTLDTTFKTLVAMQGRPMTPEEKVVFNKILQKAGQVSPAELPPQSKPSPMQMPQQTQPVV